MDVILTKADMLVYKPPFYSASTQTFLMINLNFIIISATTSDRVFSQKFCMQLQFSHSLSHLFFLLTLLNTLSTYSSLCFVYIYCSQATDSMSLFYLYCERPILTPNNRYEVVTASFSNPLIKT